jgi:L-alanine-DL-glutamate epimerase-like enolase superfamily enzyme
MRITDVNVITLGVELEKPVGLSRGRKIGFRGAAFVVIDTDEGIQGIGEGYGPEFFNIKTIVERKYRPMILGEDPLDMERIWRKMLMDPIYWDQKGQGVSAASGVDMALWDLAGKRFGVPTYQLMGGDAHGDGMIQAYASDLFWDDPDVMAEAAKGYVDRGFQAVKAHLGNGLEEDEERVVAMKESIGDADLMADMNCGYGRVEALKVGRMLERHGVFWYEEPLSPYDVDGHACLRSKLDVPIATVENEYTRYGFKELFLKDAVDYAMPDIMRCGGLTETRKICAMAEAFNVTVTPHSYTTGVGLAATIHMIASSPCCQLLEYDVTPYPLFDDLLVSSLDFDHRGRVKLPTSPGLGVRIPDELVEEYSVE